MPPPDAGRADPPRRPLGRVPNEFLGVARQLRREVEAADHVVHRRLEREITGPIGRRMASGRKTTIRPDMLRDLARTWANLPSRFRLTFEATADTICETRLVCASFRPVADPDWADEHWEPGFSLLRVTLAAGKLRSRFYNQQTASVGLHAAARWYQRQRAAAATEAGLLADLGALAVYVPADKQIAVPCAAGAWIGNVTIVANPSTRRDEQCCAIRTYIASDMVPD